MIKFIHIGYPKCLSTSLQRNFFPRHPEIFYLGIGAGGSLQYYNDHFAALFEFYVKYCKNICYAKHEEELVRQFNQACTLAREQGAKAIGASSEHISFSFTADCIDVYEKAKRLHRIFGNGAKIIVIIRNQVDLLKSVYREGVRAGYPGTFDDYVLYVYKFQEKNFVSELEYDVNLDVFAQYFGADNIFIYPYESYLDGNKHLLMQDDDALLLKEIEACLGVKGFAGPLDHHNVALSDAQIVAKAKLNGTGRHDLGNELWNGSENHRLGVYWRSLLHYDIGDEELYEDVVTKRRLIGEAREWEGTSDSTLFTLSAKNKRLWQALCDRYVDANRRLAKKKYGNAFVLADEYMTLRRDPDGRV